MSTYDYQYPLIPKLQGFRKILYHDFMNLPKSPECRSSGEGPTCIMHLCKYKKLYYHTI
jgi:hypothetical protein